MSDNQLEKIDNQKFGDLIKLPELLNQNRTRTLNATKAATAIIDAIKTQDLTKMELGPLEDADKNLNNLIVKLDVTEKNQKGDREPYTQFFDELRSMFTAEEKSVNALKEGAKTLRNNIAKEKIRRENERQATLQKETDKKNEAIDAGVWVRNLVTKNITIQVQAVLTRMSTSFYSKAVDDIDAYGTTLAAYVPAVTPALLEALKKPQTNAFIYRHNTKEEADALEQAAFTQATAGLQDAYIAPIIKERDRLVELVTSRKNELVAIANDAALKVAADERIATEQKQQADALIATQQAVQQQTVAQADNSKVEAMFDTMAGAQPSIDLAKGTKVKKKYVPTTHAAYLAIIQSWVKNEMPLLSIEQLDKKFSTMVTSANKRLNEGEELKAVGLLVEDDVTTTMSKPR